MAPDLDVLIRSSTDPLLFLEYHRQFTHALAFIPLGALLVSLPLMWMFRRSLSPAKVYLACLAGYATHGLLDASTSYGTQLLWPFSNLRVAWNLVPIVDPLFTLPLLVAVIAAAWRSRKRFAVFGVAWALLFVLAGWVQHQRANEAAVALAAIRDHQPERLTVKPGFGNLMVWKSIYVHEGRYFVDALHAAERVLWCGGSSVTRLNVARDLPNLDPDSQQYRDLERFRGFSDDFLSYAPAARSVSDIRYSLLPDQIAPLWGIRLDPGAERNEHVTWWTDRRLDRQQRERFLGLLRGQACRSILSTNP
jgi:inner membrane protein